MKPMLTQITSRAVTLIIVLLMLVMPSIAVTHAVEHDLDGHTEYCAEYTIAEQTTDTLTISVMIEFDQPDYGYWVDDYTSLIRTPLLSKLSRAPPVLV